MILESHFPKSNSRKQKKNKEVSCPDISGISED